MIQELGYARVGTAVPRTWVGAVQKNVAELVSLARQAEARECDIVLFPELCVTSYCCGELFHQRTLLAAAEEGLSWFLEQTRALSTVCVVGLPLAMDGQLFNCAAVVKQGRILGVVPKTFVPGYKEYYEPRWFAAGTQARRDTATLCAQRVPFGTDLLFREESAPAFCFGIEVCEDLWAPIPPSSHLALAGAALLLNPSASNDLVGKAQYRRQLVTQQSARCLAAYAYASAGVGESTTDLVFGGHAMIVENGVVLLENERFNRESELTVADVDLDLLASQRLQNMTFSQELGQSRDALARHREIAFDAQRRNAGQIERRIDAHPFVPADPSRRAERCREIFALQSTGLATRLAHTGMSDVVIGLSGGLDSTLALLVCVEAFNRLGLDRKGIHCVTMPGFGTSDRTLGNVMQLGERMGIALETVPIAEACELHFRDIGHDGKTHDVTYENVQARERTQILMDKANMLGAVVVGTGDLSELALGWCTYNGDHMSMYGVNAGVPKTLVKYLIEYVASYWSENAVCDVLRDILATPISPELLPTDENGAIAQKTESVIGPYELHDFFLYNVVRCGFRARKIVSLACQAFDHIYDRDEIRKWLAIFYRRFFSQQFKRSCLPDGPKIGTVSLSPRGDWRMPSDAHPDAWLAEIS